MFKSVSKPNISYKEGIYYRNPIPNVNPNYIALLYFENNYNDSSPNNLSFTPTGTITYDNSIKKQGSYSATFTGSEYLEISHSSILNLPGVFTIDCWAYFEEFYQNQHQRFFSKRTDNEVNGISLQRLDNAQGGNSKKITFSINSNVIISDNQINNQNLTHIAATRDSSNLVKLWINGSVQSQTFTDSTNINYNVPLRIGRGSYVSSAPSYTGNFNGKLDAVRIIDGVDLFRSNFDPNNIIY